MAHIMEHIDKDHLGACVTWERDGYSHFVLVKNDAFERDICGGKPGFDLQAYKFHLKKYILLINFHV